MELKYTVKENNIYKKVQDVLIKEFELSNRLLTKLIKNKNIYLNNKITDTRAKININDIITVNLDIEEDNSNVVSTKMELDIIYEDEWFIIINKPPGIAIHPSCMHYKTSLSNGIKYHFDKIGLHKKIRPVTRLDFNTSGLCIFAKCEYIQEQFSKQMAENTFKKEYLCIAEGILDKKSRHHRTSH